MSYCELCGHQTFEKKMVRKALCTAADCNQEEKATYSKTAEKD
jgi:hypothetical protein